MGNRWGTVETVADFIFLGSEVTVDGDYRHEIERCLLLGRKVMTNLDSILGHPSVEGWQKEQQHFESYLPKQVSGF